LQGETWDIHHRKPNSARWQPGSAAPPAGQDCLVTGLTVAPARLHQTIKGVFGAQTSRV